MWNDENDLKMRENQKINSSLGIFYIGEKLGYAKLVKTGFEFQVAFREELVFLKKVFYAGDGSPLVSL